MFTVGRADVKGISGSLTLAVGISDKLRDMLLQPPLAMRLDRSRVRILLRFVLLLRIVAGQSLPISVGFTQVSVICLKVG